MSLLMESTSPMALVIAFIFAYLVIGACWTMLARFVWYHLTNRASDPSPAQVLVLLLSWPVMIPLNVIDWVKVVVMIILALVRERLKERRLG